MARTLVPPEFRFVPMEVDQRYHAYGDNKRARRYEVFVDGDRKLGHVYTTSTEVWDTLGRVRVRLRGYSRAWRVECPAHLSVSRPGAGWPTRLKATVQLLEHYERIHEGRGA